MRTLDDEVADLVKLEEERQRLTLNLIASENYVSPAALEAQSNILVTKAVEGYPGKRYFGGCSYVDALEMIVIERAKKLFGAEHANVQCVTGTQANLAVYLAALQPGDPILAMDPIHGGHLSHGSASNISGKLYRFIHYGVDKGTERINYDDVRRLAQESRPRMIIAGASAYPRELNFAAFREIADEVGAYLLVDMAHIAGLIVAGIHQTPVPYADFITSSTHKTLRGPRGGGLILCKKRYSKMIDEAVFPGLQSAPLLYVIAARAVVFKEAMSPRFKRYQEQVVKNARSLAEELMSVGFKLVSNGTDTHLMLVDLRSKALTGVEAELALEDAGIIVNRNAIPFDERDPSIGSGVRIGTPAVTTRGMKEEEMIQVARLIDMVLDNPRNRTIRGKVRKLSRTLAARFPLFSRKWQG